MADVVIGAAAIGGALLTLIASIGVLRLQDLYSRIHAATKAPTLGIAMISLAGAIAIEDGRGKILLAVVLIFITAPSAAHFIGRAAYRAKGVELRLDGADDLATTPRDAAPYAARSEVNRSTTGRRRRTGDDP